MQNKKYTLDKLSKENILVVGTLGKTGKAITNYLINNNISISLNDKQNINKLKIYASSLNKNKLIKNIFSGNNPKQLNNINRIILSPGVPRTNTLIKNAIQKNITITGEIELAATLSPTKNIIGITGTDGKSTTATLTYKLIKTQFPEKIVKLGGNIGIPFISFIEELEKNSIVILELSSYMLEGPSIPLNISCLLNVNYDHMDRYKNFNHYMLTKKNIFAQQNNKNYAIINADDPNYNTITKNIKPKIINFSTKNKNTTCYLNKNSIFYKNKKILSIKNIPLKGIHNNENILAASTAAILTGVSTTTIYNTLKNFKNLEHRCEPLGHIHGINFINDSKATTTQAVYKAILSQKNNNVILLMGGQNKKLNFKPLKKITKEKVKSLILYGEAKKEINTDIKHHNTHITQNIKEAFEKAIKLAKINDTILLSPACTSFDQFKNYKERGKYFKNLVEKYKNSL